MSTADSTPAVAFADSLMSCSIARRSQKKFTREKEVEYFTSPNNNSIKNVTTNFQAKSGPQCEIGPPAFAKMRCAYRLALRPDRFKYVTLTFRVMRHDAEMHIGLLLKYRKIKRTYLYSPEVLDRWTISMRIKIKASVKVATVFKSLSARLGIQNVVGLRCCLDGFYGLEAYGDAFGSFGTGICPWMEVTGDGTALSLNLVNGQNVYINVATEKMIERARQRIHTLSEQILKQGKLQSTAGLCVLSNSLGDFLKESGGEGSTNDEFDVPDEFEYV